MEQPKVTLATKWGEVVVTFLNPDRLTGGHKYVDGERVAETSGQCVHVQGELTINRVGVRVSQAYGYVTAYHKREGGYMGELVEYPDGIREFRATWDAGYNRRSDGSFKDLPDGVKSVIWTDLASVVEEAYSARPDLQRAAVRFDLYQGVVAADKAYEEARNALLEASKLRDSAADALAAFDAASGEPEEQG